MSLLKSRGAGACLCLGTVTLTILMILAFSASGAECDELSKLAKSPSCDTGGDWNPTSKLDEIGTGKADQVSAASPKWPEKSRELRWNQSTSGSSSSSQNQSPSGTKEDQVSSQVEPAQESAPASTASTANTARSGVILAPLSTVSDYDVILDVSDGAEDHIPGAVYINYRDFLKDGRLKPVSELATILGDAGISADDSLVVYGECQPCGGGPAVSTYIYWVMRYLGQERIALLNGGIANWTEEGYPVSNEIQTRPKVEYVPEIDSDLMATYDYVASGQAQIVDARTFQEFGEGTISGAISIPYTQAMKDGKIKSLSELEELFLGLEKDKPVVTFTATGVKASMLWFALELAGYDAKIYTYQDWVSNQPKLAEELKNISASPNPAKSGDAVKIIATFGPVESEEKARESSTDSRGNASQETLLTVKGCATCGFGNPQIFAGVNPDSTEGAVQLGKAGTTAAGSSEQAMVCQALIRDPDGNDVKRINMQRTTGGQYVGTWNANVPAGIYKVSIVASSGAATAAFRNALDIEITGSGLDTGVKRLGSY
jgi:thiosulfate/3-mercaptopyruvate sulfurtransferase